MDVGRPEDGAIASGGTRPVPAIVTAGDSRELIEVPNMEPAHYEASGTSAIQTMMQIVSATKAATGNANMIRYHDQMLNASVNTFARVA